MLTVMICGKKNNYMVCLMYVLLLYKIKLLVSEWIKIITDEEASNKAKIATFFTNYDIINEETLKRPMYLQMEAELRCNNGVFKWYE
jgi:hypothetical protein